MKRLVSALLLGFVAIASSAKAEGPPKPSLPACIRVQTQSRWIPYGYNHIVIIENGCSKAATCDVSTDVNPQSQSAEVAVGKSVEVTTFMGSAAADFVAKVTCTLH
jgi:hypothetical protein